ncbi:hypothetical protein HMPREF9538_04573 [Klebsiella sp. MS 92-3]|nr:hypothetical protein HMPREF9538_04573 [Klebsiella sp. MS 92-3]
MNKYFFISRNTISRNVTPKEVLPYRPWFANEHLHRLFMQHLHRNLRKRSCALRK